MKRRLFSTTDAKADNGSRWEAVWSRMRSLYSLLALSFAIAPRPGVANSSETVPLFPVLCASLLVAPEFETLGRARPVLETTRRSAEIEPRDVPALLMAVAAREGRRPRRLTFNRVFTGEADVRAYLDRVLAWSEHLQSELDAGAGPFWNGPRVNSALRTAGFPALTVATLAAVGFSSWFNPHPHLVSHVVGLSASGLLIYNRAADFLMTARYLRAAFGRRWQNSARNHEPSRAREAWDFLSRARVGGAEGHVGFVAVVPPRLSDLMMDPARLDDAPEAHENVDALIREQLRTYPEWLEHGNTELAQTFFLDLDAFTDEDSVPHLSVTVTVVKVDSARPTSRRRRIVYRKPKLQPGGLVPAGI